METNKKLSELMQHQTEISLDDFPDIDLYMDQILTYLARQQFSQRDSEKLTSAMVNNYIKDGLLPRANGKKYAKEHLLYLTIISKLKQVLSVKDTDLLLKSGIQEGAVEDYFHEFMEQMQDSVQYIQSDVNMGIAEPAKLALRMAVISYLAKVSCEFLLDEMAAKKQPEEDKSKKKPAKEKPAKT